MPTDLAAYWWSPRRSARTLRVELRDHGRSWLRTAVPPSRAFTNHGDELNSVVLPELTGRAVRWVPLGREEAIGVGSIVGLYLERRGRGLVLGSGATDAPSTRIDLPAGSASRFLAVRGPATRSVLGLAPDLPVGDPGLVVRAVRGVVPTSRRRGKVVVPHFHAYATARDGSILAEFTRRGWTIMSPTTDPRDMIDAIARAEVVASSGMHGVILSHALRTPAALFSFDDVAPAAPGHKFADYNASVGAEDRVISWRDVLLDDDGWQTHRARVSAEGERIGDRIDDLVDGLFRAAAPLRAGR